MKFQWPPTPLGLGTPLNLAYCSEDARSLCWRSWYLIPFLGILIPALMLSIDQLLFSGSSLTRVRELGSEPLLFRILVVFYSGITEELIYRLFLSTIVAYSIFLALLRNTKYQNIAQWMGIIVAAVLFGLAHVGNIPDAPQPILRAIIVNGVAGIILGWLFWWRGLEVAIFTHMTAIAVMYIVVPIFI